MLNLTTGNYFIQVITGSALSLDWIVSYESRYGDRTSLNNLHGNISTATTTNLIGTSSTDPIIFYGIHEIILKNRDAASSNAVTLRLLDNNTAASHHITPSITLLADETLIYANGKIQVFDTNGLPKFPTGFFLTNTELRASPVPVTDSALTDKSQFTKITDGTNTNGIKALNVQVVAADYGIITNSVIHGLTSAGGGSYVDIKATPSGAMVVATGISATATATQVADNAASTTLLASNTSRLGATISNDSSGILYLLLGSGTASTTNYTVRMVQYAYYEVPAGYTGQINGIWATDPNDGAARITELT